MAKKEKTEKIVAPGNAEEVLCKDASKKDIKEGNFTKVTRLSFDEVDPS